MLAGHDNTAAHQFCEFILKRTNCALEDHFVRFAKIIEVFKLTIGTVSEFGAAALADGLVFANLAFRMSKSFLFSKTVAAVTSSDL